MEITNINPNLLFILLLILWLAIGAYSAIKLFLGEYEKITIEDLVGIIIISFAGILTLILYLYEKYRDKVIFSRRDKDSNTKVQYHIDKKQNYKPDEPTTNEC